MKPLSKTMIQTYEQCPLLFKFRFVDELQEPENEFMRIGKKVHAFIEAWFGGLTEESIRNGFYMPQVDDWEIEEHIRALYELERMRYGFIREKKLPVKYFLPVAIEQKLKDSNLSGVIDRIDRGSRGLIVVELKTGSLKPEHRDECVFYKLLAERVGNYDKITHGTIISTKDRAFDSFEITQEMVDDMEMKIELTKDGIKNKEFEPRENEGCVFCYFKDRCPLGGD